MATVNWNALDYKTPPVQGGIDGSTNHVGPAAKGIFRVSDLPTSGTAGPKLKIPAGTIPTSWSVVLLDNKLAAGKSVALTFAYGGGTLATATVAGDLDGSDEGSDYDEGTATPPGPVASGKIANPALNTSDAAYVTPTRGALDPATDGDALVLLRVNLEVVDRSKIYLW